MRGPGRTSAGGPHQRTTDRCVAPSPGHVARCCPLRGTHEPSARGRAPRPPGDPSSRAATPRPTGTPRRAWAEAVGPAPATPGRARTSTVLTAGDGAGPGGPTRVGIARRPGHPTVGGPGAGDAASATDTGSSAPGRLRPRSRGENLRRSRPPSSRPAGSSLSLLFLQHPHLGTRTHLGRDRRPTRLHQPGARG